MGVQSAEDFFSFFFHKQKIVGTVSLFFFFMERFYFPLHTAISFMTQTLFELRRRLRLEDENESGPMVLKTS